jgi:AraC-like DNA-binding protein
MMVPTSVNIQPLKSDTSKGQMRNFHNLVWVKRPVEVVTIDGQSEEKVTNALYFIHARLSWSIVRGADTDSAGYVVSLPKALLENPAMHKLHIQDVSLLAYDQVPKINLSPGIAVRVQAILEMIDELVGSELNNREAGILSLINTLFVYCDGQCNIRSAPCEQNSKKAIVFRFKKLIDKRYAETHEVGDYAQLLHISDKYLNQCTQEVLGVNAKHLIDEIRIMRSRHMLKFSDLSIKEISYSLGFSSQDYFSYFLKRHTGLTPSMIRNQ